MQVPALGDDESIVVANANFSWGFKEKTEEEKKKAAEAMMGARGGGKGTRLFALFIYKNDHFTKTGSGQI
jgi:hypothetical protein